MRRRITAWTMVTFVCLLAARGAAQAEPAGQAERDGAAQGGSANEADAREAFERGRVLYDRGEFTGAATAFEKAYRLSGRDALLYNLYLAHRDANQPRQAAEALRSFLEKVPEVENRPQLEARLEALEEGLQREQQASTQQAAQAPAAPAGAAAGPRESRVLPEQAPVAAPRGRSPRFIAGVALASVGGALALGSLATGLAARAKENELESACGADRVCTDPGLRSTRDRGERLARTTDALLFGGVALAAAGAILLVLDLRSQPDARAEAPSRATQLRASCFTRGCAATATMHF